jgi:hypothetical protein
MDACEYGDRVMSEATSEPMRSQDDLIEQIARQTVNEAIFDVYINTRKQQQRAVKGQYPSIVAVGRTSKRVEFVGMVETTQSLHNFYAAGQRWRVMAPLQAGMYIYVPKGYCADARTLCLRETIHISDFRHYWFDDDGLHVEKCFA